MDQVLNKDTTCNKKSNKRRKPLLRGMGAEPYLSPGTKLHEIDPKEFTGSNQPKIGKKPNICK